MPPRPRPRLAPLGYQVSDSRADGFTFRRPGAETKVLLDGKMMRWATSEWVSQSFLDRMKRWRDQELKAPRGDATGCWQKVAEVPFSLLLDRIPKDAWDDTRAVNRLLNDSDYRYLRCDGNHRRV